MIILAFIVGVLIGILFNTTQDIHNVYHIRKDDYYYRLRSLKLFLRNQVSNLNEYLTKDPADESILVDSLQRYENQIEQINKLLTAYGRTTDEE